MGGSKKNLNSINLIRPKLEWVPILEIYSALIEYYTRILRLSIKDPNLDPLNPQEDKVCKVLNEILTSANDHLRKTKLIKIQTEALDKIEKGANFKKVRQRLNSTPPSISKFVDVLAEFYQCDKLFCRVILAELIRTGSANLGMSPNHTIYILIPSKSKETIQNDKKKNIGIWDEVESFKILKVQKKHLQNCLKKCNFPKFSKTHTLRYLSNLIGGEILLSGLIIEKLNPELDLSGDLAESIYKRVQHFKKEDLQVYEKVCFASYGKNHLEKLNGFVNLNRVIFLLEDDLNKRLNYSTKKQGGLRISWNTRKKSVDPDGIFIGGPFCRDLIRYGEQKENQSKLFPLVEKLAWNYLTNPNANEAHRVFLPHIKPKKGPSDLLLFLPKFRGFIDCNYLKLSKMLNSNNKEEFSLETRMLLEKALKDYFNKQKPL